MRSLDRHEDEIRILNNCIGREILQKKDRKVGAVLSLLQWIAFYLYVSLIRLYERISKRDFAPFCGKS